MIGQLKLEQAPVTFELALGGDWQKHSIAEVESTITFQVRSGHALRVVYFYLPSVTDAASSQLVPLSERTQREDGLPFGLAPLPVRSVGDSLHVIDMGGKLQVLDSLALTAGTNIDLINRFVNWYGGGIAYNSNCRCFGCALTIRMVRGQSIPDVLLFIDLGFLGSGGFGTMNMF